ncbi:hypothetical protein LCGC14_0435010 [marine sediment metagenome]|uniref:Uncharacterized protein n=1 Tax=marine sediment metagenome TaxID=412755 RepID=A0A0F9STD2_9ZZZZ
MPEEKIMIDIHTANETVKGLNETIKVKSEQVKALETREQNIQDSIHRADVKKVQDNRNEETKISVKLIEGRQKLEGERAVFESGKRADDIKKGELARRFHDLETREKEIVDIDKAHKKLNEERQRFDHYKFNIERELEQANITITEAGVQEDKLEAIRSEIEGMRITLKEESLKIDTERGELTEQRKDVQSEIEHLEGLKKWHEHKKEEKNGDLRKVIELAGKS